MDVSKAFLADWCDKGTRANKMVIWRCGKWA